MPEDETRKCCNYNMSTDVAYPKVFVLSQWQKSRKVHRIFLIYRCIMALTLLASWIYILTVGQYKLKLPYCFVNFFTRFFNVLCYSLTVFQFMWALCKAIFVYILDDTSGTHQWYWMTQASALSMGGMMAAIYWGIFYSKLKPPVTPTTFFLYMFNVLVSFADLMVVLHPVRRCHCWHAVTLIICITIFNCFFYYLLPVKEGQVRAKTCGEENRENELLFEDLGEVAVIFLYWLISMLIAVMVHLWSWVMFRVRVAIAKRLFPDSEVYY